LTHIFAFTVRKYEKKRIFSKKMRTFAQIIEKRPLNSWQKEE